MVTIDQVKNFTIGTVATVYDDVAVSILLSTGHGDRFPDPDLGEYNLVYWNATDYNMPHEDPEREIVRVIDKVGDVLTIERGQEDTIGSVKNRSGKTYLLALIATAKTIDDIRDAFDTKQDYSDELTAIALITSGNGYLKRSALGIWSLDPNGGLTIEDVQDGVATMIQNGTGISWAYNDTLNTLTPTVNLSAFTTDNLPEGATNKYYTDARVATYVNTQKGAVNGLATLGADQKIPIAQLPLLAISDTFVVSSEVDMLALTAQTGDVAIRTDENKSYILGGSDPTVLSDWKELLTPTDTVLSVNGMIGAVIVDFQSVTDQSAFTSNDITVHGITINEGGLIIKDTVSSNYGSVQFQSDQYTFLDTNASNAILNTLGVNMNGYVGAVNDGNYYVMDFWGNYLQTQYADNAGYAYSVGSLSGHDNSELSNGAGYLTGNQTITLSGDITGSGSTSITTAIASGVIVNGDINASAAIALTKLAALTASRAVVSNGSGFMISATTTAVEIGYVSGVTSAIQTQIDAKQSLNANLTALAALSATGGMLARTGAGAFAVRTITGTANQVLVSNGNGVSGDPTLSLPQNIHTTAGPTFSTLLLNNSGGAGLTIRHTGYGGFLFNNLNNTGNSYFSFQENGTDMGGMYLGNIGAKELFLQNNASLVFQTGGYVNRMVIDINGFFTTGNSRKYHLVRTVPTAVNDYVELGAFTFTNGGGVVEISLVIPSNGFSVAKKYLIPIKFGMAAGAYVIVNPVNDTGPYSGGSDVTLEVTVSSNVATFRMRKSATTTTGTAYITIIQDGINTDGFVPSTTTGTTTAPTGILSSTPLTQQNGFVGIGTNSPLAQLHVVGHQVLTGYLRYASTGGATLTMNGLAGNGADIYYANGGVFRMCESNQVGTNDVFFQGLPATTAGYTFLESWQSAGMVVGTGSNLAPVLFAVQRNEVGRFDTSQRFNINTGVASGGFNGSNKKARVGGKIKEFFANAGNTTTTETDLYSYTTEGGILAVNGEEIDGSYGGIFVSSGTATRQIKMYFAGTVIFDSGALSISTSASWVMSYSIIRVSATVVRYRINLSTQGAALSAYTSVGELTGLTLSATNIMKITGQASGVGAATNDIVAHSGDSFWWPVSV